MPVEFEHEGFRRRVHVFASEGWLEERSTSGLPLPMLVVLHDEDVQATPQDLEQVARIGALTKSSRGIQRFSATRGRFVVLLPEGLWNRVDRSREQAPSSGGSWNSGHRGRDAKALNSADVEFLEQAIHEVATAFKARWDQWRSERSLLVTASEALDASVVFLIGVGNGAELAYRAAVHLSSEAERRGRNLWVKGVVAVCGSNGGQTDAIPEFPERGSWIPPVTTPIRGTLPTPVLRAYEVPLDDDFVPTFAWNDRHASLDKAALLAWLTPFGINDFDAAPWSQSGYVSWWLWGALAPELAGTLPAAAVVEPDGSIVSTWSAPGGFVVEWISLPLIPSPGHGWPGLETGVDLAVEIWNWAVDVLG